MTAKTRSGCPASFSEKKHIWIQRCLHKQQKKVKTTYMFINKGMVKWITVHPLTVATVTNNETGPWVPTFRKSHMAWPWMCVCTFVYTHIYEDILRTGKSLRASKPKVDSRFGCIGQWKYREKREIFHILLYVYRLNVLQWICVHILFV